MTVRVTVLLWPTASLAIRASTGPPRISPGRAPVPVSFSTPTATVIPRATDGPRLVIFVLIRIGVPADAVEGSLADTRSVVCETAALAAAGNSTRATSAISRQARIAAIYIVPAARFLYSFVSARPSQPTHFQPIREDYRSAAT